jgi:hypothetical protein
MRGRLRNGSVVELAKECLCLVHEGPCWVHRDRSWREHIDRMIVAAPLGDPVAQRAMELDDRARRAQLEAEMGRRGIVELLQ